MLKIQRAANGEVVFSLIGRMDGENVAELETILSSETKGRRIVLDLKDLTLVDRDAVGSSSAAKRTASRSRIVRHTSANGSRENEMDVNETLGYHHGSIRQQ